MTVHGYAVVPNAVFEFLSRTMPFRSLDRETVESLCRECVLEHYPRGTLIFKQGVTDVTHVCLVQTGGVKLRMSEPGKRE